LGRELLERLERIRTDPQFEEYIKFKERWKNEIKNKQAQLSQLPNQKQIENHLRYISMLVKNRILQNNNYVLY